MKSVIINSFLAGMETKVIVQITGLDAKKVKNIIKRYKKNAIDSVHLNLLTPLCLIKKMTKERGLLNSHS